MENVKETIVIRDFVLIRKADIEIKRINIIIGPQANGKSLIAKLIHFFKSMNSTLINAIRRNESKREANKTILAEFEQKFPRYSWEGSNFSITYLSGELGVSIYGIKGNRGRTNLSLEFNKDLEKIFNSKRRLYSKKLTETKPIENSRTSTLSTERRVFIDQVIDPLQTLNPKFFSEPVFIPASRSFFTMLENNIFTFLASNVEIDPFLKEFGSLYVNCKRFYRDPYYAHIEKAQHEELKKIMASIIAGEYEFHDKKDWIVYKTKRTSLANASSGQQESLPMLLVLCMWPFIIGQRQQLYFIEEPEAHLFPTSQAEIVAMLSMLYKNQETSFFITTHSPYILSALNNLILAHDVISLDKMTEQQFNEANGPGKPIRFEEVSAYTINNGIAESISDASYRMIGGEMLDSISEHFEEVMSELLIREGKE